MVSAESSLPPLYYAIAGAWWQAGKLARHFGRTPAVLAALSKHFHRGGGRLAGLAYGAILFPGNIFVRLAVPALIAFMPQTTFYSINNDILSPLVFGAAFLLLLKFWRAEMPAARLAAATGLALAASYLAKLSTLPMLAIAGLLLTVKMVRLAREKKLRAAGPALAILAGCAALPMLAWMIWCKINFGDLTGSAMKIQYLGWSDRPFSEWFSHPLFTPHGFWIFVSDTFSTFWQGEFLWFRQPLAIPALNLFYAMITIGVAGAGRCGDVETSARRRPHRAWVRLRVSAGDVRLLRAPVLEIRFSGLFLPFARASVFHLGTVVSGNLDSHHAAARQRP